ncbi:uroporphyrinogen-III C-methyltransferase [Laribacter hongkongensis]|uniref:uroporphyrinogen-III C-methyltransferase n=1 Tax=Laribacter hongkongensis TaxID=168471 RepID=A0A248LIS0_9NEIS|nr:uroporphyrinogen-III C-methyltransferase [Laribacter hongkongensis]ASJ24371.1 uroporphyrin-III methyltransferase [Laribacter hongkongensis]MCG9042027.1 uroporphyrinogen-III C-methyltransferase [Laribacter hongkongensis]MCG9069063.1 uroporphyrinogen-III C-methyltransferase [Laribacter hongkongensis]MCG9083870.1 uroporphyrinogen-III C-methyltransferase [Laribacter hongkongensis]MCG9087870.1 uroporphyrinogen-III C-methyltransferase [Laribacter hongkongensis]
MIRPASPLTLPAGEVVSLPDQSVPQAFASGSVVLVGAGPGSADLLTLRAMQRLSVADVVLYDYLIDPDILQLAPSGAHRICVGKRASRHTLPQSDINQLLIGFARQGLRVVRLKGGDPFMFGRGGEEMHAVLSAGIPCESVPGISAALGAAASLLMPLTHRDHAQGCCFVTGHRREGQSELAWTANTGPDETLVVYMGLGEVGNIARQLMLHGRAPETPVAVIEQACMPGERCVCGQLATLGQIVAEHGLRTPSLLVIGSVVRLHEELTALRTALNSSPEFLDSCHSVARPAPTILRSSFCEYTT